MNIDRTGPEPHECEICHKVGMPPEVMPYFVSFDPSKPSHKWCHPMCVHAVMEAKRKVRMKSEAFAEIHESNDGQ